MLPLTLVACCSQKALRACEARDLYLSPLFRKSRTWAERRGDWMILSAKYGVVQPTAVIAPYDLTLTKMSAAERAEWDARVARSLAGFEDRPIVVLAGQSYLGWCSRFPCVTRPLEGLGIGKRLAWLDRANSEACVLEPQTGIAPSAPLGGVSRTPNHASRSHH